MPVMSAPLSARDLGLLRSLVERLCGVSLGEEKAYLFETRLGEVMAELDCQDFGAFYQQAIQENVPGLRDRIVDAMTTHETLWFRDVHPFQTLREKLLPELARGLSRECPRVRLWSGACSTGQEPYSLAITILEFCREYPAYRPGHFEILASDVSAAMVEQAREGRYDGVAVGRGLSAVLRDRYFKREGDAWCVRPELKGLITFRRFNLLDPLEPLGELDVVFLRYVSIYFADPFKRSLYGGVAKQLSPGGSLFVSAVESLRGLSDAFAQELFAGGSYYRRL